MSSYTPITLVQQDPCCGPPYCEVYASVKSDKNKCATYNVNCSFTDQEYPEQPTLSNLNIYKTSLTCGWLLEECNEDGVVTRNGTRWATLTMHGHYHETSEWEYNSYWVRGAGYSSDEAEFSYNYTMVETVVDGVSTMTYSGSNNYSRTYTAHQDDPNGYDMYVSQTESGSIDPNTGAYAGTYTSHTVDRGVTTDETYATDSPIRCCFDPMEINVTSSVPGGAYYYAGQIFFSCGDTVYSNPITVESMFSDTVSRLEEAQSCIYSSGSSMDVRMWNPRVSLQQSAFIIKHDPSPTCYLKVWRRAVHTYTDQNNMQHMEYDYTRIPPYIWVGSENPCRPAGVDKIESEPILWPPSFVLPSPLPPSSISEGWAIDIVKYSFLPDYEPDISDPNNKQPNGFPDPSWKPQAP